MRNTRQFCWTAALLMGMVANLPAGLVASYDFAGGNLDDGSGHGNTAAVVGGFMTGGVIDADRGEVFNLTGGGGYESNPGTYLELPVSGAGTGSWTMAMWIHDGGTKNSYLFDNRDFVGSAGGAARLIFSTEHNTPGGSGLGLFNGTWADGGSVQVRDGDWHHVAWAYDDTAGTVTMFTDGAATGSSYAAADLLTATVRLGNRSGDGAASQSGRLIDDVFIYDHALDQTEIDELIAATGPSPVVPPVFQITEISGDLTAETVDLTWTSEGFGAAFEVLGTEDLSLPVTSWAIEASNIPNGGETTSTQLTGITSERRFFVVHKQPPPVSGELALVPWPESITVQEDQDYTLAPTARILYETRSVARSIENSLEPLANVLAGELELVTGTRPTVIELSGEVTPLPTDIVLGFEAVTGDFAVTEAEEDQAYTLSISDAGVVVRSQYFKGVAYGTATLLQALHEDAPDFVLPVMEVDDRPAAAYRAVQLDVARQIHSIGVIKDTVRMARLFKVRYLHLHLTDDQNFTYPFPPVTDNIPGANFTYTPAELDELVAYADARGVTIIPEMDLPGHSTKLQQSGYLNPSSGHADVADPANYAKIQAIIDAMLGTFASSPYFHIGGDESSAGSTLVPFLEAMNNHLRGTPTGGKRRMLVWEGFHGAPTSQLPATGDDRIIVHSWESSYNPPWSLLSSGYELINSSWKPMYVVGGGTRFHPGSTSGKKWDPEVIHRWNKDIFMHWEPGRPVFEDAGPNDPDLTDHEWDATVTGKEDQIIGGQLLFWEQTEFSVMRHLVPRIPAMAERLWNPALGDDFATLTSRADVALQRVMPIVQPVQILPLPPGDPDPIIDIYQPYEGSSLQVTLVNRTKLAGTIRYEEGPVNDQLTSFEADDVAVPTSSSPAYGSPLTRSGAISIRARLFRTDGSVVDGDTWGLFNNWPNRVQVTEYDIGELGGSVVPDMAAWPVEDITREYGSPVMRGAYRNVELVGQLQLTDLTPPGTGDYVISMKTQHGHASLYLDLNRNGSWDAGEKLITDTPNNESVQDASPVTLQAGVSYPLRVDHKNGIPRPVLVVYLNGPGTSGRQEISPWLTMPN